MSRHGMPKLLCVCGRAKIYEAKPYGVALFWGPHPVAIFSDMGAAINYLYNEFGPVDYSEDEEEFKWEI